MGQGAEKKRQKGARQNQKNVYQNIHTRGLWGRSRWKYLGDVPAMEGQVWEEKTHRRSLFLPSKKKKVHVFLYAYTPVCRHILVSEIKQSTQHMFQTCWCLQFGSSIKHAKASGSTCLISITEKHVLGRWPMPTTWIKKIVT